MSDQLVNFMNQLNTDADLQDCYEQNPMNAMQGFGLSDSDIALVSSGDEQALHERCRGGDEVPRLITFHTP